MASGENPSGPSPAQSDVNKAVIDQIAKEIQSGADIITSLRTRSAFTIWIGPYIVLGSILVAVKGGFIVDWSLLSVGLLIFAALGYLAIGNLAGRIERYTMKRSNGLRQCITSIMQTGKVDRALYLDEELPGYIVSAYTIIFFILLACFVAVAFLASEIKPRSAGSDNPARAQTADAATAAPTPSRP
jgi:hypothetical protein